MSSDPIRPVLSNGLRLPEVFLGTWDIRSSGQADMAVEAALQAGYRGIDTAACYENESVLGSAIGNSGLQRNDLTVTSKVWNDAHGFNETLRNFDASEKRLGAIDIYLIHWPGPVARYLEVWKALEHLYDEGRVKAIGVSNFMVPQLEILIQESRIAPMVNQIESHLWFVDEPLVKYCRSRGVAVQGFSPLAAGTGLLGDPILNAVALSTRRSPAQVALRYLLQIGILPVPKSSNPERIRENHNLFDFSIPEADIARLRKMNRLVRTNKDPLGWFGQDYQ